LTSNHNQLEETMSKFRILLAMLAALSALLAGPAGADSNVKTVSGHVDDEVVGPPHCTSPVGICTVGRLTGGIQGDLEFTITSLTPAEPPGVLLFTATSTIHTTEGDIFCADSGSFNTAQGSAGEGVHLCVITGGTGEYAGASGYLQEMFHFQGTVGQGEYRGKVVTAS
jgi:hypothetical protein